MDGYNIGLVQQGWQCPICKRIYSPLTMMCFYCNNGSTKTSTRITPDNDAEADSVLNSHITYGSTQLHDPIVSNHGW